MELVDTAHESQIWGAHFDGDAGHIFRIQTEIGRTSNEQTESKLNDEGREVLPEEPFFSAIAKCSHPKTGQGCRPVIPEVLSVSIEIGPEEPDS